MDDDGALLGVDEPELHQLCRACGSDDKEESLVQVLLAHRVVERVEDVLVGDAVEMQGRLRGCPR